MLVPRPSFQWHSHLTSQGSARVSPGKAHVAWLGFSLMGNPLPRQDPELGSGPWTVTGSTPFWIRGALLPLPLLMIMWLRPLAWSMTLWRQAWPYPPKKQGRDLFAVGLAQHISVSGMMWAHTVGLLNASAGGEDSHSLSLRAGSEAGWPLPRSARFPTSQLTAEVNGTFDVWRSKALADTQPHAGPWTHRMPQTWRQAVKALVSRNLTWLRRSLPQKRSLTECIYLQSLAPVPGRRQWSGRRMPVSLSGS